ncbi:MAG: carbohydrate kinase [Saprospiraceae bacterium]
MLKMSITKVICFGEFLWDLFPTGKIAGGAPMNVAYHLKNLGLESNMISQVGHDELGKELLKFVENCGMSNYLIDTIDTFPTGTVQVELKKGSPTYIINEGVAWDHIAVDAKKTDAVKEADALVYGSLICREKTSRETLFHLAELAGFRVFDMNLRAPFHSKELILKLLYLSDILKLSEEELDFIAPWLGKATQEKDQLELIAEEFNIDTILLTKGAEGAICYHQGKFHFQESFSIKVKDTVGSGDAFLAGFLKKMFEWTNIQTALKYAAAMGAIVASQAGGTPMILEEHVSNFINIQKQIIS